MVAKGLVSGAIASSRAGQLFNLIPLERGHARQPLQSDPICCAKVEDQRLKGQQKCLWFAASGVTSRDLFAKCWQNLQHVGVNLTRIESRPARTALGEYIFFIDLDGTLQQPEVVEAVRIVEAKSLWLKNLGMYGVQFPVV